MCLRGAGARTCPIRKVLLCWAGMCVDKCMVGYVGVSMHEYVQCAHLRLQMPFYVCNGVCI